MATISDTWVIGVSRASVMFGGSPERKAIKVSQLHVVAPKEDITWTKVVAPDIGLLNVRPRELWHYRDLIVLLVYRDFVISCRQTILGPIWWMLQPILLCVTYVLIFSVIARVSTDGIPPVLFFLSGLTFWFYFIGVFSNVANTFSSNASIFGQVYFPRLVMPIAWSISALIKFSFQLAFLAVCYLVYVLYGSPVAPQWTLLLLPFVILYAAALATGCGLIMAALTSKYRDLTLTMPMIMRLWRYLSAVVIPMSAVPENYRCYFDWNPVVPAVEIFRHATLGSGTISLPQVFTGLGMTAILLLSGLIAYSRASLTSQDTV
ncbi:MAG TPA: ABC transporter permease [Planctomycetaceae bacterium]|nr:ABC transporter permease [Planctomycetaceae bacterium]